jgi:hypothetical protein
MSHKQVSQQMSHRYVCIVLGMQMYIQFNSMMLICHKLLQTFKCALYRINMNNRVAKGTVYLSTGRQTIHGVPLQDDCFRVSIDEAIKGAAFLPVETSDAKTVEEALHSFVAWPKNLVKFDEQVRFLFNTRL